MNNRQDVWRALHKRPGITAIKLAKVMQMRRTLLTRFLWGLRMEGFARNGGNVGYLTQYWTVGDRPPDCLIGTNPKSIARLNKDPVIARERLAKALAVRGHGFLEKTAPVPANDGCLLAQCWNTAPCTKLAA